MTAVIWPWKRRELALLLKDLADPIFRDKSDFDIDHAFHFLFDDTDLAEKSHSEVGTILRDGDEAEAMDLLCQSLDAMLKRLGDRGTDVFLRDDGWSSIENLAKTALACLEKNGIEDANKDGQP